MDLVQGTGHNSLFSRLLSPPPHLLLISPHLLLFAHLVCIEEALAVGNSTLLVGICMSKVDNILLSTSDLHCIICVYILWKHSFVIFMFYTFEAETNTPCFSSSLECF